MASPGANESDSIYFSDKIFHDCQDHEDYRDACSIIENNITTTSDRPVSIFSPVNSLNASKEVNAIEYASKQESSWLRISISSPPLLSEPQNSKKSDVDKREVTPDFPFISFPTSDSRKFFVEEPIDIGIDMQCVERNYMVLENLITVNSRDTQRKKVNNLGTGGDCKSAAAGSLVNLHIAAEDLHKNFPSGNPNDAKRDKTGKHPDNNHQTHPSAYVQINLIQAPRDSLKSDRKDHSNRINKTRTYKKKSRTVEQLGEFQAQVPKPAEQTKKIEGEQESRVPNSRKSLAPKNRKLLAVTSSNRGRQFSENEVDAPTMSAENNTVSDQPKVTSKQLKSAEELSPAGVLSNSQTDSVFLESVAEMSVVLVGEDSFISGLEAHSFVSSPKKLRSVESVCSPDSTTKDRRNFEDKSSKTTKLKSVSCKTTDDSLLQSSRKIKFPVTMRDNSGSSYKSCQSHIENASPQRNITSGSQDSKEAKNKVSVNPSKNRVTFNLCPDFAPDCGPANVLTNVNNKNLKGKPFSHQNSDGTNKSEKQKENSPIQKDDADTENSMKPRLSDFVKKKPRCRIRLQRKSLPLKPITE